MLGCSYISQPIGHRNFRCYIDIIKMTAIGCFYLRFLCRLKCGFSAVWSAQKFLGRSGPASGHPDFRLSLYLKKSRSWIFWVVDTNVTVGPMFIPKFSHMSDGTYTNFPIIRCVYWERELSTTSTLTTESGREILFSPVLIVCLQSSLFRKILTA